MSPDIVTSCLDTCPRHNGLSVPACLDVPQDGIDKTPEKGVRNVLSTSGAVTWQAKKPTSCGAQTSVRQDLLQI